MRDVILTDAREASVQRASLDPAGEAWNVTIAPTSLRHQPQQAPRADGDFWWTAGRSPRRRPRCRPAITFEPDPGVQPVVAA